MEMISKKDYDLLKEKYDMAVAEREANVRGFTEQLSLYGNKMTLRELIESKGYTVEAYNTTVDMLMSKGIANGCYQDYSLLSFVIDFITNTDQELVV